MSKKISFVLIRLVLIFSALGIAQLSLKDENILVAQTSLPNMIMVGIILYSILYTLSIFFTRDEFFPVISILDTLVLLLLIIFQPSFLFIFFVPVMYHIYMSGQYNNVIGYIIIALCVGVMGYMISVNPDLIPHVIAIIMLLFIALVFQLQMSSILRYNTHLETEIAKVIKDNTRLENARLVSEKNAQTQKELATTDYLTGLTNRSAFLRTLEQYLDSAYARDTKVGLLLMDIDFFKKYNDTYGHAVGDETLKVVSKILKDSANFMGDDANLVARYGGEEMVIAIPNANMEKLTRLAETVRKSIESQSINLIKINTQLILEKPVTISIGAILWGREHKGVEVSRDSDVMIDRADEALYQAKANGRNRVVIYMNKH